MPKRATSRRGEGSSLSNDNSESESEPESQRETDSEEEMKKMATMYKYQPRKKNFYRQSHQRGYDPRYAEVKVGVPDVVNLCSDFL